MEGRWPHNISISKIIKSPKKNVWNVISTSGILEKCHPYCFANKVKQWPGKEARDTIEYLNGLTFERRFISWKEGDGYSLMIGEKNGPESFLEWKLKAISSELTELTITVHPHYMRNIPKILSFIPYYLLIIPKLSNYLESVTSGFDWFIETGKPIPKNHFGKHKWFS
jgi:hypothetical protein